MPVGSRFPPAALAAALLLHACATGREALVPKNGTVAFADLHGSVQKRVALRVSHGEAPPDSVLTLWLQPKLRAPCSARGTASRDLSVRLLVKPLTPGAVGSDQLLLGCVDLPRRRVAWMPAGRGSTAIELLVTFERAGAQAGPLELDWRFEADLGGQDVQLGEVAIQVSDAAEAGQ